MFHRAASIVSCPAAAQQRSIAFRPKQITTSQTVYNQLPRSCTASPRNKFLVAQARNNINWEDEYDSEESWDYSTYGEDDDLTSSGIPQPRGFRSVGRGKKGPASKKRSKKNQKSQATAAAQENMMEDSFYDSYSYDDDFGVKSKGGKKKQRRNKRSKNRGYADAYSSYGEDDTDDISAAYGY